MSPAFDAALVLACGLSALFASRTAWRLRNRYSAAAFFGVGVLLVTYGGYLLATGQTVMLPMSGQ